jgi:RNA polymerase sigma-70 factor (ECF subfamily)
MPDHVSPSDEAALVLRAQAGDGEAFRALVEQYDRRLLYFIRRIVDDGEEAYDVLQAVWLAVYRKLRALEAPQALRVWLYRIAHDQAVSFLRRRRRPLPLDELTEEDVPDDSSPDQVFETAEEVHRALGALSVEHRRVLTLRFLEDMSIDQIAQVLDCPAGTVKSRLHYAKAALRRTIAEHVHG